MVLLVSAHSAEILSLSTHVPEYFLHPFKLCFFIAKFIHCRCTIYISMYLPVADLQNPHDTFKKLQNAQNSLWEGECVLKKWSLWMWSLARKEQYCFQIKSRTSQQTWNTHRALTLCAFYPQSCMGFLTILGTTALMACSFRHTGQIQSCYHQNLAPLSQNSFWYCPNFVCHISLHFFEDRNFGVTSDETLVDLLTVNCKD